MMVSSQSRLQWPLFLSATILSPPCSASVDIGQSAASHTTLTSSENITLEIRCDSIIDRQRQEWRVFGSSHPRAYFFS